MLLQLTKYTGVVPSKNTLTLQTLSSNILFSDKATGHGRIITWVNLAVQLNKDESEHSIAGSQDAEGTHLDAALEGSEQFGFVCRRRIGEIIVGRLVFQYLGLFRNDLTPFWTFLDPYPPPCHQ